MQQDAHEFLNYLLNTIADLLQSKSFFCQCHCFLFLIFVASPYLHDSESLCLALPLNYFGALCLKTFHLKMSFVNKHFLFDKLSCFLNTISMLDSNSNSLSPFSALFN